MLDSIRQEKPVSHMSIFNWVSLATAGSGPAFTVDLVECPASTPAEVAPRPTVVQPVPVTLTSDPPAEKPLTLAPTAEQSRPKERTSADVTDVVERLWGLSAATDRMPGEISYLETLGRGSYGVCRRAMHPDGMLLSEPAPLKSQPRLQKFSQGLPLESF